MLFAYTVTRMLSHFFSSLSLSFGAVFCFVFSVICVPVNKRFLTLDSRLFLGFFSSLMYVLSHVIVQQALVDWGLPMLSLFLGLIGLVSVLSFWMALFFRSSQRYMDYSFAFSVWYSGLFSVFLAFELYVYLLMMVLFLGFYFALMFGLRHYQMSSAHKTLIIRCESYQSVEAVNQLLDVFQATVVSYSLSKSEEYTFQCEYKLSVLAHHVFCKHVFNRADLSEVIVND